MQCQIQSDLKRKKSLAVSHESKKVKQNKPTSIRQSICIANLPIYDDVDSNLSNQAHHDFSTSVFSKKSSNSENSGILDIEEFQIHPENSSKEPLLFTKAYFECIFQTCGTIISATKKTTSTHLKVRKYL